MGLLLFTIGFTLVSIGLDLMKENVRNPSSVIVGWICALIGLIVLMVDIIFWFLGQISMERLIQIITLALSLLLLYAFHVKAKSKSSLYLSEPRFKEILIFSKWQIVGCIIMILSLFRLWTNIVDPRVIGGPSSVWSVIYGILMVSFAYFMIQPFMLQPIKLANFSNKERLAVVMGILSGFISSGIILMAGLSWSIWMLIVPAIIGIYIEISRKKNRGNLKRYANIRLFKKAFYGTCFVLLFTLFIPIYTWVAGILALGTFIGVFIVVYKTTSSNILFVKSPSSR